MAWIKRVAQGNNGQVEQKGKQGQAEQRARPTLGPMPEAVRAVVRRLVAEARPEQPDPDDRINGFLLCGGRAGNSFLDADGEVWDFCSFDGSVARVPDGPRKVELLALAAERVPELAAWLPARPPGAVDCPRCCGSGCLPPPWSQIKCSECGGLGWVA
jgi:hypothetical protein